MFKAGIGHVLVLSFVFSCCCWDVGVDPGGCLDVMRRGLEIGGAAQFFGVGVESVGSFLANAFWPPAASVKFVLRVQMFW